MRRPNWGASAPGGDPARVSTRPTAYATPRAPGARQGPPADELGRTRSAGRGRVPGDHDRHGPGRGGFYGSGQLDSEAGYLASEFKGRSARTNHSNSRLCMASP